MIEAFSPSPDNPVLVLGAAGMDIVGRLRSDLDLDTSNAARIRTSFGGVARNVAENLARLGQPVILLTAVGADEVGAQLVSQLSTAGVDTNHILHTAQHPTGSYIAVVNAKGSLQIALDDMRAIATLTPEYLHQHEGLFKQSSCLFLDANLSKETLRSAFSLARRARLPVCADPAAASLAPRLQPYLPRLKMITPNHTEAAILSAPAESKNGDGPQPVQTSRRHQAMECAKRLVSLGVEIAIVTLAELGVCYAASETSGHIPAIRTEIADPTGAGDALTAAVIFALLNDIPLDDALRLGVSAAALTLKQAGTVYPDLSLEKLYDQLVI